MEAAAQNISSGAQVTTATNHQKSNSHLKSHKNTQVLPLALDCSLPILSFAQPWGCPRKPQGSWHLHFQLRAQWQQLPNFFGHDQFELEFTSGPRHTNVAGTKLSELPLSLTHALHSDVSDSILFLAMLGATHRSIDFTSPSLGNTGLRVIIRMQGNI